MTTPDPHGNLSQAELAHLLGQPILEPQNFTQLGNGLRLVELYGADFRQWEALGTTFVWEGTMWAPDKPSRMYQFAQDTIRSLYRDAALLLAENGTNPDLTPDEQKVLAEKAEATAKWARQSESQRGIEAMIALAKQQPGVQIDPKVWDVDPMLLNCPNGTLDLRTQILRPHAREDYITKVTAVFYDSTAGYQAWDDFLARIIPNQVLRSYLQRALGYSITGLTTEEKLFMPWGPAATGKSTLLGAVMSALGDYAAVVGTETFVAQRGDTGPREDIARLAGKRFILATETESNQRLATSLLKKLSGGDLISARYLYRGTFEFVPTGKIWISSNNRPVIPHDDTGMWRRVSQPPFLEQIPETEQDPGLKLALLDPQIGGPAVLKWLVDGCAQWLQFGLGTPEVVRQTSAEYRQSMDSLADFIQDTCIVQENAVCANPSIWTAYQRWCQENGERRPLGRKGFTQRLEAKGFRRVGGTEARLWHGIGLIREGYRQDTVI